ncbi:CopG family antitoxin [uncultured Xylophilus sp.]|uniref:CopG family antitoxin n=1 Tax=uncultured Xylophilus sp. TaxID=296832 RepID=UPI0025DB729F|nr:CopG family antitoxin [uncultured Xylophilus sp.]
MKHIPKLTTDADAEAFLETDLSGLDFGQFQPMRFEIAQKEAVMLDAVRAEAQQEVVPHDRHVRAVSEADLQTPNKGER